MNDSPYGLTASIWTKDIEAAQKIGNDVNVKLDYEIGKKFISII